MAESRLLPGEPLSATRRAELAAASLPERHVLDYVRVLAKRRWTALPVLGLAVAAAVYVSMTATPLYEARAQLLIESEAQKVISFQEVVQQAQATADFYQTQYRILQSRTLAAATVDALDLWKHPEFTAAQGSRFAPGALIASARELVDRGIGWVTGGAPAEPAAGQAAAAGPSQSQVLGVFASRLTVAPVRNSRLVDVTFKASDPKLAADVANMLADVYIRQNAEYKFQASKQATDWLTQQLTEQRSQVEQTELALQRYREQHANIATDNSQNIVVQKLTDLNAALTRAKTERLQREAVYQQVTALAGDRAALSSFPAVVASPRAQAAKTRVTDLQLKVAQLAQQLGDKHPELIAARDALATAQGELDREVDAIVGAIADEFRMAEDNERRLANALEGQKREALALNRHEIGYRALERDAVSNRQIFESLLQRAKETGISGELKTNNIRVADKAPVPRWPVWPRTRRNVAIGFLVGALLAVALAFGVEYLDNKIKSPDEIKALGLPCLGLVPEIARHKPASAPLLNNGVPPTFAEAFRVVRSNLLFANGPSDGRRTLVVTSSGPGEGKTVVSSNLAVGLAMIGRRVVLVDADMRRPQVHAVFACPQTPGIADVLAGTAELGPALQTTSVPNLTVLASGSLPDNPAEMLSGAQFRTVLERLSQSFDWVVIDSPPVMPVTDASVLANAAAGVVFVVGAEVVPCPTVLRALEQLDASQARYVGAVLNRVELARNSFFYSPYFRREYTKYYGTEQRG